MAGTRPMLFGIAVILASGFILVHDAIRYGYELGPVTGIAQWGLLGGLAISFLGLLYGTASATQSKEEETSAEQ
ncbi:hypothetical protein [Halorussus litoreus]|uniref:hypothetical protein n=1 Tax=Halorussus litoreus TaxID=1710536 RepID=UPI0013009E90|nr:hypothetical protein [Halorussus litoreus]